MEDKSLKKFGAISKELKKTKNELLPQNRDFCYKAAMRKFRLAIAFLIISLSANLIAYEFDDLNAEISFESPFTQRKIDVGKLIRFKGKSSADIIGTLRKEGVQFVFLGDMGADPRNADFAVDEIDKFRANIRLMKEWEKTAAFALPRHYLLWEKKDDGTAIYNRIKKNDKPTIGFQVDPGSWPEYDTVLHEYTHILYYETEQKLVDAKQDGEMPTDDYITLMKIRWHAYNQNAWDAMIARPRQVKETTDYANSMYNLTTAELNETSYLSRQELDAYWTLAAHYKELGLNAVAVEDHELLQGISGYVSALTKQIQTSDAELTKVALLAKGLKVNDDDIKESRERYERLKTSLEGFEPAAIQILRAQPVAFEIRREAAAERRK